MGPGFKDSSEILTNQDKQDRMDMMELSNNHN